MMKDRIVLCYEGGMLYEVVGPFTLLAAEEFAEGLPEGHFARIEYITKPRAVAE